MPKLDYKTCKALKDAGFPQEGLKTAFFRNPETGVKGGGVFHIPTLSELIEACGEVNFEFHGSTCWAILATEEEYRAKGGSSYIEAVSNLYLALNKKDD